jgi:hypothetical protein
MGEKKYGDVPVILKKTSFLLLILTVFLFLSATSLANFGSNSFPLILLSLSLFGFFVTVYKQCLEFKRFEGQKPEWKPAINTLTACAGAALLTFWLSQSLGIGSVLASAAIGLAGSVLLPKLSTEIFTGSFVGMYSKGVAPQLSWILLAGLIAGLIYHASRYVLVGFGGKLGTIAFAGVILATLIAGGKLPAAAAQISTISWFTVILAGFAAGLTWLLADHQLIGVVRASSVVGLIGGLVLPFLFPLTGSDYAVAVFCASFVGMVSHERISKLIMVIMAGALAGLIFQFSASLFCGIGGKLGTIAMSSVLSIWGFKILFMKGQQ